MPMVVDLENSPLEVQAQVKEPLQPWYMAMFQ